MDDITINSWNELMDRLYDDSWQSKIKRFRSPYIFRGMADAGFPLMTALERLGGNYAKMEPHLLRNFRKYAHRNIVERDTTWH